MVICQFFMKNVYFHILNSLILFYFKQKNDLIFNLSTSILANTILAIHKILVISCQNAHLIVILLLLCFGGKFQVEYLSIFMFNLKIMILKSCYLFVKVIATFIEAITTFIKVCLKYIYFLRILTVGSPSKKNHLDYSITVLKYKATEIIFGKKGLAFIMGKLFSIGEMFERNQKKCLNSLWPQEFG